MTQLQSGYSDPVFSRIQAQAAAMQAWVHQPASSALTGQAARTGLIWGALFFVAAQSSAGSLLSGLLLLVATATVFAAVFLDLGQGLRAAIWTAVANALFGMVLTLFSVALICGLT